MTSNPNDIQLFKALVNGDISAFDKLFNLYYPILCRFALTITREESDAEESVQDVFVRLWEKRKQSTTVRNVKSYLFKATYNQCLLQLKNKRTRVLHENEYAINMPADLPVEEAENWEAFRPVIQSAVNQLPDKCRQIFLMRRYEGLTNNEIAEYLNISVKTVENQLTIAINKLRIQLKPHIKQLIILFFIDNL